MTRSHPNPAGEPKPPLAARGRSWSRTFRSITWQLPLAIALLLLVVVGAVSWNAYREVRAAALDAAGDRLADVGQQLAGLLAQSAEQRLAQIGAAAADPAVLDALIARDSAVLARAAAVLRDVPGANQDGAVVALWDSSGSRVVATVPGGEDEPPSAWAPADSPGVSGFRTAGDTIWYEIAAPVRQAGRTLGHVAQRRRLSSSPDLARLLADLIGMDADFFVGVPGGAWTDLAETVAGPDSASAAAGQPVEYAAVDERRYGLGTAITGTPWLVWVEFPSEAVLERPRIFLLHTVPIGLLIVLIGAGGGLVLSRRVTSRLARLTESARAMAGGDYTGRVASGRPDEIGELAVAFNIMAERVQISQEELEAKVATRTSELRASEKSLRRHATELEATNRELESFSYSVSHDLRAPLRSINGFSQALLEDCADALDERGTDYLNRVCAAAERMGELIDDLLALSRLTRAELRTATVDLSKIAADAAAWLQQQEPDRRVEFEIAEDVQVEGDVRLLRVAIENLLENAWKFTAREQDARIEFGMATEHGEERTCYVRDNGAGFDMEYVDQLFGAFQRLHSQRDYSGSGIGLATVQRIVHRHGGQVRAEGKVGEGATFYLTLPRSESPDEGGPA